VNFYVQVIDFEAKRGDKSLFVLNMKGTALILDFTSYISARPFTLMEAIRPKIEFGNFLASGHTRIVQDWMASSKPFTSLNVVN
jgi:hypothetical protein